MRTGSDDVPDDYVGLTLRFHDLDKPGYFIMSPEEAIIIGRALIDSGEKAGSEMMLDSPAPSDDIPFTAIGNSEPLPEGLPEELKKILRQSRNAAGRCDHGNRIGQCPRGC